MSVHMAKTKTIGEWKDPRKEFGKAVSEIAEENGDIVVISTDSGFSSGFNGPPPGTVCGVRHYGAGRHGHCSRPRLRGEDSCILRYRALCHLPEF